MTSNSSSNSIDKMVIKYGVCLKSHATKFGHFAVDGCCEFVKMVMTGLKKHIFVLIVGENVSISRPFMREILSTRTPQVSFPTSLPGLIRDPVHENALRDLTTPM
ncbi:hypothetical protein FXO37_04900 [Capsicum annuum]|nr:hypothetical protein FXO37_04900 [Capsicum annuum]